MGISSITPYLNYDGDAAAAIEHYREALGAEVEEVNHFREMPEQPFGPEAADRIMHASLRLGAARVMLSDVPPKMTPPRGGNAHVAVAFDDVDEMMRAYHKLAETGEVMMELHDSFWGPKFGMVTDRFGVRWMLNGPTPAR